jgi:predicted transcriptional regulator
MFNDAKDGVKYRRRSRLDIIAEILDAAIEGAVKTRIMYKVSVNFVQFNEYVKFLLKARLINVARNKKRTIYKTTGKGRLLLRRFKEAEKMLSRPISEEEARPLIAKRGPIVYLLRK